MTNAPILLRDFCTTQIVTYLLSLRCDVVTEDLMLFRNTQLFSEYLNINFKLFKYCRMTQ